jgi:hypothetical protein
MAVNTTSNCIGLKVLHIWRQSFCSSNWQCWSVIAGSHWFACAVSQLYCISLWSADSPFNIRVNKLEVPILLLRLAVWIVYMPPVNVSNCRSQWPCVGLRPLACWDRGFESHRVHGCLSLVCVVCCQVEVSATDWSLVHRSPTDCGASLCVIKKPRKRGG